MSAALRGGDPEVNKFEQAFSDGHRMSLAGIVPQVSCPVGRERVWEGACTVNSSVSKVTVT